MAEPFLRWAGGKRWLARDLAPLLKSRLGSTRTYIEPFLGGGAVFFALQPRRALLADLNRDLIQAYKAVAWRHRSLVAHLSTLPVSREQYYQIRRWQPNNGTERAVRLIYLNQNCYGGLYRENKMGEFNVPFGGGERNHRRICRNGLLPEVARILRQSSVELLVSDFEGVIARARRGDVVYCDPTYREVTRKQFDRYGRTVFDWRDQERLAKAATEAFDRGALVLLSNATCTKLRRLYPSAGLVSVARRKGLGSNGNAQSRTEFLLVLDPMRDWPAWSRLGSVRPPRSRRLL